MNLGFYSDTTLDNVRENFRRFGNAVGFLREQIVVTRQVHGDYIHTPLKSDADDWSKDGTSDFGRIARQQDFLRRVVAQVIGDGLTSPSVASALITTNQKYLVTDTGLTVNRMLEFANTLRRLDPTGITTYRIESASETLSNGDKVERPRIGSDNMKAILSVFAGQARLAEAPDQIFQSTTTSPAPRSTTTTTTIVVGNVGDSPATATSTLPVIVADDNAVGIVPDRAVICD